MIKLLHRDCLDLMKDIPDKSIDLIVIDPPGIACKNLNRNFIRIEKDEDYFNIAKKKE